MYQSIYYSYKGEDKGTCYLRDDVKGWSSFKYYPAVYKLDPDGEHKTLFGDCCSPIRGKFDWNDPTILEKDIQKELAVLRDLYYQDDSTPVYHNILYLDIEMEILGTLTAQSIRDANAKITSIALIDVNTAKEVQVGDSIELNDICKVSLKLSTSIAYDTYSTNRKNGAFILINEITNNTVAAGVLL